MQSVTFASHCSEEVYSRLLVTKLQCFSNSSEASTSWPESTVLVNILVIIRGLIIMLIAKKGVWRQPDVCYNSQGAERRGHETAGEA